MLKIYDKSHTAIGHIIKYRDLQIESDVKTGDKTLSFTYLARYHEISEEYYVEDRENEYVIKESHGVLFPLRMPPWKRRPSSPSQDPAGQLGNVISPKDEMQESSRQILLE